MTDKDIKTKALEVIKELSIRDRCILSLYYYEDLNYKEIAQILSISVVDASKIHSNILNKFKDKLK